MILEIEWVDTVTHPGWHVSPHSLQLMIARTVGYLVNEDNEVIRLACTVGEDGQSSDVTVIPKCLIKKKIKHGNGRRPK